MPRKKARTRNNSSVDPAEFAAQGESKRQERNRYRKSRRRRGLLSNPSNWVIGGVVVLLVIVVGASVLSGGGVSGGRDFEFTTYQGDAIVQVGTQSLSDITGQGRPVLLNFWAGNCPPCRAEMPAFQRVYEQFGDRIVFLGLDVGPFTGLGSKRDGEALLLELGITYPIATTRTAQAVTAYGVISMPTTVFFNAEGNVHRTWSGAMTENQLSQVIRELIDVS